MGDMGTPGEREGRRDGAAVPAGIRAQSPTEGPLIRRPESGGITNTIYLQFAECFVSKAVNLELKRGDLDVILRGC